MLDLFFGYSASKEKNSARSSKVSIFYQVDVPNRAGLQTSKGFKHPRQGVQRLVFLQETTREYE